MLRRLGRRLFKRTFLAPPLWRIYDGIRQRWKIGALRPQGWYTVTPSQAGIERFEMYSDGLGPGERAKIRGEYEPDVTQHLLSLVDESTVFWEVGGRYGYHTNCIAPLADRVVVFEADPDAVSKLQESVGRNGYGNVRVVEGTVGGDISLDSFPAPDVVLMDIEGWEQHVLESIEAPFQAGAAFIVELHENGVVDGRTSEKTAVVGRFEEFGYTTETISTRHPGNYHIFSKYD